MIQKYLQILEYPKILEQLSNYTKFSASQELALQLKPTPFYTEASTLQTETSEACHLLAVKPDVGIGGAKDVRPLIEQARRGAIIFPPDLLSVRQTLISARELRRKVTRLENKYPHLADIAYQLEDDTGLVNYISECIDDNGKVKDSASSKLAQIRREIDIAHSRIMEKMRRLMASEKYKPYLQEGFITQRDGRYVLPLKTDFKGRIKGIIHDQSTSGATVFVEPTSIVETNNKWKQLQIEEDQEVKRILLALSQRIAERGKFIAATIQALAELDLIFAKARYAVAIQATAPILNDWDDEQSNKIALNLKAARHPLLDPETVVPIDLTMKPDNSMVVITGPNTGGKTVSLKTIGLLTLMAQSGLQIPANDGSSLMVFDAIFADIGDEQSLEQSLSTFSAHMTNIVNILNECTYQSLVVFDELGAGTDPIEGAALALSILSYLLDKQTTTLVATHYAELKAFAYTTSGVANASMAFDLESLSPTYKLQVGLPGNSNAFAIAKRLGLSDAILQMAQGLVGEDAKKTEMMLAQIQADMDAARMELLRLEEERAEAEYYRQKTEERLTEVTAEREKILAKSRKQAQQELKTIRAELKQLKQAAKKAVAQAKKANLKADASKKADSKTASDEIEQVEATLDKLEAQVKAKTPAQKTKLSPQKRPLKIGSKVKIPHLNSTGLITAITQNEIEVQLGHFRTSVKRQQVLAVDSSETEEPITTKHTTISVSDTPSLELDLRGQISEQAMDNLETYLDSAYLSGLPFVRIIHGKGSGVLRKVIRNALKDHPLISSYKGGTEKEGGEGVTIAKLAI